MTALMLILGLGCAPNHHHHLTASGAAHSTGGVDLVAAEAWVIDDAADPYPDHREIGQTCDPSGMLVEEGLLEAAHGGGRAGGIAVEEQHDLVGVALEHVAVVFGQGGARGGGHVLDAGLRQANQVHIALNHQHAVLAAHGVAGVGQPVEHPALVVARRLGRVEILRFLLGLEGAGAAEPKGTTDMPIAEGTRIPAEAKGTAWADGKPAPTALACLSACHL